MERLPRLKRGLYLAVIASAVIAVIPFLAICAYVFPVNDDFYFATEHIAAGPLAATLDSWLHWSGRYLGTFISSINPFAVSSDPLPLFGVYSLLTVLLTFLAFTGCGITLFGMRCGKLGGAALGSFLFSAFLTLCPSPAQAFYWFSSVTSYTLPSLLSLLFFAILPCRRLPATVLCALLALLIPGGNEVLALLFVMTLLYLAYTYHGRRLYLFFFLSAIGLLVVILSPGNSVRMEAQASSHPYIWTFAVSVAQTLGWGLLWLPALIIGAIIYVPLWGLRLSRLPIFNISFRSFLLFSVSSVFLAHIPSTLGLSSIVTDRTANVLLLFFIIYFFWGTTILTARYRDSILRACRTLPSGLAYIALFAVIFTGVLSPRGNFAYASADLIGSTASRYHARQMERMEKARMEAAPDTVVTLLPLGHYPATIYVNDLPADTADGFTKSYAEIFGIPGPVRGDGAEPKFSTPYQALRSVGKATRSGGSSEGK